LLNYVLQLELNTLSTDEDVLNKTFEISKKLYNISLNYYLHRYQMLRNNKYHKKCIKKYFYYKQLIDKTKDNKLVKIYTNELNSFKKKLNQLIKDFGITEYDGHSFIKTHKHYYSKYIDINTAQTIASRAYKAIKLLLFDPNTKKVKFKKELLSVEGKTNKSGIRFKNNCLYWNKLTIPAIIRKNDLYAQECLDTGNIKYCRITKKFIKNKYKYYIQLIMEGEKSVKLNKSGHSKQIYGADKIGIDTSFQFVAVSSTSTVKLLKLGEGLNTTYRAIKLLQRKLDRQRRSNNPNKYNIDGTFKKGNRDKWINSNKMRITQNKLKHLYGLKQRKLKQSHEKLANYLLTLGTDVYVENINYKALKKKIKEPKINPKTGRFKSKKGYGKSIQNKAPALFLETLNKKLNYIGKELNNINIYTFKASQYNHYTDTYEKKKLSERWTTINKAKIQRDLYSAFLIMNSKQDLSHTDREECIKTFKTFKKLHKSEMKRIANLKTIKKIPSAWGF